MDRFTLATLKFFENVEITSSATVQDLLRSYRSLSLSLDIRDRSVLGCMVRPQQLRSSLYYSTQQFHRNLSSVFLTELFGHVTQAHAIRVKAKDLDDSTDEGIILYRRFD